MANIRQRGKNWAVQLRRGKEVVNFTRDTLDEAEKEAAWAENYHKKHGCFPDKYRQKEGASEGLGKILRRYRDSVKITPDDARLLNMVALELGQTKTFDYAWAEQMVAHYKAKGLAPGTVRKYVGAVARALDWAVNASYVERNPLRQLPKNYSSGCQKPDQARSRRLEPADERLIRASLEQNPTWHEYLLMFDLALETAMRMREIYTLSWEQIDFEKRTIFLEKTKNGDKRQVPMSSVLLGTLPRGCRGQIFTLWDGDLSPSALRTTTTKVSKWWQRLFQRLGIEDLRFHDLRREATSRLFERTDLGYVEIAKITGHKSTQMLMRYANLRGSNLADRLW